MKWLKFILSHSIFISFCAIALCYQTYTLLHVKASESYYGFVFFATLGSYNFYWLISKYSFNRNISIALFVQRNASYILMLTLAAFGMLYFLMHLSAYYGYISVAIVLTLLYSLPLWPFRFVAFTQKAGFMKPVLLAFTWAYITVVVPAAHILQEQYFPVLVLLFARFCFMLLLCLIFDMRDMKIDQMHALHTLATDVSRKSLQQIMYAVFFLYIIAGFFVRHYFDEKAQMMAFIFTGILVWVVYKVSLKERGYFFYYFLVDGLMLLSPLATYIAAF